MLNDARYAAGTVLVAGPGLRHRLLPRARRLGAAAVRLPGRHLEPLRRHLPRQLVQERAAHGRARAEAEVETIQAAAEADPSTEVTVDLENERGPLGRAGTGVVRRSTRRSGDGCSRASTTSRSRSPPTTTSRRSSGSGRRSCPPRCSAGAERPATDPGSGTRPATPPCRCRTSGWGQRTLARLPLDGDETVLELGCGTGRDTEALLAAAAARPGDRAGRVGRDGRAHPAAVRRHDGTAGGRLRAAARRPAAAARPAGRVGRRGVQRGDAALGARPRGGVRRARPRAPARRPGGAGLRRSRQRRGGRRRLSRDLGRDYAEVRLPGRRAGECRAGRRRLRRRSRSRSGGSRRSCRGSTSPEYLRTICLGRQLAGMDGPEGDRLVADVAARLPGGALHYVRTEVTARR